MRNVENYDSKRIIYRSWDACAQKCNADIYIHEFDCTANIDDINDILELYNVYKLLNDDSRPEIKTKLNTIFGIIARFYKTINDSNFHVLHSKVIINYYDDYLELFEKFKAYENVSDEGFSKIFLQEDFTLYKLLKHEHLVHHYDCIIAEYMRSSDQSAEVIIRSFLEKKEDNAEPCYIPKSLVSGEYESIIQRYVDSDYPHIGLVGLVSISQSTKECPLSDELKLHAQHRVEELFSRPGVLASGLPYGIGVSFDDIDRIKQCSTPKPNHHMITYDVKWLNENLDFPTILNNFIFLFEFCDMDMRCKFPVVNSTLGIFERFGVTGNKEYKTGIAFQAVNNYARMSMHAYYSFLLQRNIYVEDVIQWFFDTYISEEFGITGFEVNIPPNSYSVLDKCKLMLSELDGILKQYNTYIRKDEINRPLFEMSSNPVSYVDLPSRIPQKYAYVNNKELYREMQLCFSDQSILSYIKKYYDNTNDKCFAELILSYSVNISDYEEYNKADLLWLNQKGVIALDDAGLISLNYDRVMILRDLYDHEVIRGSRYKCNSEFRNMIDTGDLCINSSLFSIPETDYLNYMFNKSEFSNGKDLRNKYIHSTYPKDKEQQYNDYIDILRIIIVVLIKLNEEFSYIADHNLLPKEEEKK